MKIASIVGARPQFIKAAAVSRELRKLGIENTLIHTGQHYDENMSEIFFDQLAIPRPAHDLGVGSGSQGSQTGLMLERVEGVLQALQPDWTLVFGDTNSTLAGALAAANLHLRVAHVEAGLRSFNRRMPEEINRVLTDHCSDLLFAPTPTAVKNLRAEGISHHRIQLVGDVMYDAALYYSALAEKKRPLLAKLDLPVGEYVLATFIGLRIPTIEFDWRLLWADCPKWPAAAAWSCRCIHAPERHWMTGEFPTRNRPGLR